MNSPLSTRVERRMAELARHLFTVSGPVGPWRTSAERPAHIPSRPADALVLRLGVETADGPATPSDGGLRMPAGECRVTWASATATVPPELDGHEIWLLLETTAEALVYVDGTVWQGLDVNRPEVLLATEGEPGREYSLDIMFWSGRDHAEKTLRARLATFDRAVSSYRYDLQAVAGAARTLSQESTTAIRLWRALEASMNAIDFHGQYGSVDTSEATRILQKEIERMRKDGHGPAEADLYCVGNSHIDVAWLWTLAETRQKMGRTTATALRYMDEYPGYQFAQSQAQLYAWLMEDFPELFVRVQQNVKSGQWQIAGPCWIEPDCNISGGEALVRQILHGQRFWQEYFGFQSRVLWLPDTFGYAWALPQILHKSGIDTFVTQKLQWNDTNRMPHGLFLWEGVDGTRIRCIFPRTYTARALPEEMAAWYKDYPSKAVAPAILYPYGFGDGGGGPVREDLEMIARLGNMPGFPRCRHLPLQECIDGVIETADRWSAEFGHPLPVWKNELYLEFHRGTLTTNGPVKRGNRKSELLLREAEIWSVLAEILADRPYPADDLDKAWKGVLLNQFHDILPGTSIAPVYEEALALYAEIKASADVTAQDACAALVEQNDAETFSVFNSTPWTTTEWVELEWKEDGPIGFFDDAGEAVPVQVLESGESGVRVGFEATVQAFGAVVFHRGPASVSPPDAPFVQDLTVENRRFSLELLDNGTIGSLFDKHLGREWLAGPGNVFQTFDDRPNSWEAWDVNDWAEQKPLDLFTLQSIEPIDDGPVRAGFRLEWHTPAGSKVVQKMILYRTIPRIDFLTEVEWREQRVLWKVAFPVNVHRSFATYDIQFGAIERPTGRSTSWEQGKFEVCGHKWTDLSEANGGVSLLNDCKYGHDIRDSVMRISLLRSPTHPDPREPHPPFRFLDDPNEFSDQGRHVFRYSVYPHEGDWRGGTVQQACSFNQPLRVVPGRAAVRVGLVAEPEGIVVETLKKAEDGRGHILRLYEAHGGRYPVYIHLPFTPSTVEPVDLTEQPWDGDGPVRLEGSTLRFSIRPYEIRSFRLRI